ncbi:MAG TPA: LacI family DNA-binding transcriptional regulator [Candidatus Limnocylindrales bacterium]|nr:LacI family DNA-binding transcriptional regulator [Candidatus Limnocylindrales bacterium]
MDTTRASQAGGSITLRDVASAAGVSITTVSRILNGSPSGVPIREDTRTRVLAVAAELGYKPNLLARGLRGSRMSLLGVIARDIGDPFHTQILRGINEVAQARDYRMFLGHVDYRPDVALSYGSMFERSHADGIIVVGDIEGGDATLDILSRHHRHVLGVTDRTTRRQIPGVYGDSVAGTALALDHLWQRGHRGIVCVSDARTYDGRLRIDLYERFMRDHGVGDRIAVHVTDQEPEPALEVGRAMFADWSPASPTAIYATSDTIAIGLMKAAFEAGIEIPGRLSIVGFDDIDFADFTIPPLTTISQDGAEMGRIAAGVLLEMIDGNLDGASVDDVVIPPRLVVRHSTADVPG